MELQRSASGLVKSLVGIALVISFGFARLMKPWRPTTRRKPVGSPQSAKACISRCPKRRVMIDPDSIPREEGEPAPEPKGTPRDGIQMLLDMTKKKRAELKRVVPALESPRIWLLHARRCAKYDLLV